MSRDTTKAGCTDYQGHAEAASAVPFAPPISVDAGRDELNEPERSVRPVSSFVVTTCASDTDEGDYETSSEGLSKRSCNRIYGTLAKESLSVYLKRKSTSLNKRAVFDGNVSAIKGGIISSPSHELMESKLPQKTHVYDSLILTSKNLAQSKSLPAVWKSKIPTDISTDFTTADGALMSASSMHKKKIIVMTPLISPYHSTFLSTTGATSNFRRYETRRLASRAMLPILCDTTVINDGKPEELMAEVTLDGTKNNCRSINWDPRWDIPTFVNDEGAANVTNDDDLVDTARNPYSSIKSVYFPPNLSDPLILPYDSGKSKRHQRVSTDVETLLKIDHELGPLQYQYSEIIGKTRALGLSNTGFDLDIPCHPNRPDAFGQFALSPSATNYFLDRGNPMYLRRAAISSGIENRSALVDNTSPSSTFSVVGKLTPRGSRTSWLNENGSGRRQEALSLAIHDPSRTLESFDSPWSSDRVRNSISYFPTTNSPAYHAENVLNDRSRDGCVFNSNFQSYRISETVTERATSASDNWFARGIVNRNPSNVFSKTEYNSHQYLNRAVEDSRRSISNSFEIQRRKSSVSIVEMIDNNWPTADESTANERSNGHSNIPSSNQNSMVDETELASRDSNYHKSILPVTERVAKDDRISSLSALKSIEPGVDPDRQVLRTVSASAGVPQVRVVSVNTEFCATVEKRYTSRAVSPIQHSRLAAATSMTTTTSSPSNVLLAKVSSIIVQQVRADSSREGIGSATKIRSIEGNKRDALADAASKRDFCVQKVDSQPAVENLSRFPEFKGDEADATTTEFRRARYLRLPTRTKEKITIVPLVLTDEISEPTRSADIDFAIPRYAVKTLPKLSHQIAPFDARKFPGASSIRDNGSDRRVATDLAYLTSEESVGEERWRAKRPSVSHVNRYLHAEDYPLPTPTTASGVAESPRRPIRVVTSAAKAVEKTQGYRESGRERVARTIPGMRSTPEDFLCET